MSDDTTTKFEYSVGKNEFDRNNPMYQMENACPEERAQYQHCVDNFYALNINVRLTSPGTHNLYPTHRCRYGDYTWLAIVASVTLWIANASCRRNALLRPSFIVSLHPLIQTLSCLSLALFSYILLLYFCFPPAGRYQRSCKEEYGTFKSCLLIHMEHWAKSRQNQYSGLYDAEKKPQKTAAELREDVLKSHSGPSSL